MEMQVQLGLWPTLFGSLGALVTTFLVIPIVARMSKTMGKKNAFLVSQGISILGYILSMVSFYTRKTIYVYYCVTLFLFWYW